MKSCWGGCIPRRPTACTHMFIIHSHWQLIFTSTCKYSKLNLGEGGCAHPRPPTCINVFMYTQWELTLICACHYSKRTLAGGAAPPRPSACIHMLMHTHRQLVFISLTRFTWKGSYSRVAYDILKESLPIHLTAVV